MDFHYLFNTDAGALDPLPLDDLFTPSIDPLQDHTTPLYITDDRTSAGARPAWDRRQTGGAIRTIDRDYDYSRYQDDHQNQNFNGLHCLSITNMLLGTWSDLKNAALFLNAMNLFYKDNVLTRSNSEI